MIGELLIPRVHDPLRVALVPLMRRGIWDFSSTHNTIAFSGGHKYKPTTSVTFPTSSGSVENLNVSLRHGCTPYLRHALVKFLRQFDWFSYAATGSRSRA